MHCSMACLELVHLLDKQGSQYVGCMKRLGNEGLSHSKRDLWSPYFHVPHLWNSGLVVTLSCYGPVKRREWSFFFSGRLHVHTHTHARTHTGARTHVRARAHTHTHTHTHTQSICFAMTEGRLTRLTSLALCSTLHCHTTTHQHTIISAWMHD